MALIIMIVLALAALVLSLVVYTVSKLRSRKEKFKKEGLPYFGTDLGDFMKFMWGSMNLVEFEQKMYDKAVKCNTPIVVQSDFSGEMYVVTDLELIKNILVKDFDHFVNGRTVGTTQSNKFFKKMLFAMENEQWKVVRTKLSPSFSTGRIRRMYQTFQTSSAKMSKYLSEQMEPSTKGSTEINLSQISSKFTMDVIAKLVFGIDSKSWEVKPEEQSYFEKMGKQFTIQADFTSMIKFIILLAAPKVADLFDLEVMDAEAEGYFSGVVKDVIKRRRQSGEKRDDFLQLMLEAQQGLLKTEEGSENALASEDLAKTVMLDDDDVIANAMLFLLAGFDNTLSVIVFALYNIAVEMGEQEKLYQEVSQVLERHNGQMSYEAVSEMTYLECVIHESLRLYPPATRTERTCTQDYSVPGTSFKIEKGTLVAIPLLGMHLDARYFPEPHKFIPERFTPENKAKRHAYTYLPFGIGPRSCIAMRFAILQVKALLAQLVRDFKFEPCEKTPIPMEYDRDATIKPKGGMWLNVRSREK